MRVAVTGGSGSLGTAVIRRLIADGADRIVAFSRDEAKRARMYLDFGGHPGFRVFAGDVRDKARMVDMFDGCEVVIHGAARKVVTAHPDEPEELLKTNVLGTQHVIEAAAAAGVGKVLIISSDKAVRAENVYGVSKAMAEWLAVASNARTFPRGTRVAAIRYGNVLASNGSVVQVWRRRLQAGEPLQASHPDMTRFWLTLRQAVGFVLEAIQRLRGGEIFVPYLPAAPVRALMEAVTREHLAAAQAAGAPLLTHWAPIVEWTGIRPGGEKLHEELLSASEVRRARRLNGFYVVPPYQHDEMWDARPWAGDPVPQDLVYRSDAWPWQMTPAEIGTLLGEA